MNQRYSDDAKRLSDSVNLHVFAGNVGQWACYKIQDISTDNVAYPSMRDAVRIKWPRNDLWMYLQIPPSGMQPGEAEIYIRYNRQLYAAGFRMPDPDTAEHVPSIPDTRSDQQKQIGLLTK
jgi:hypothetical protein